MWHRVTTHFATSAPLRRKKLELDEEALGAAQGRGGGG
jgi:hypothetical protein